MSLKPLTTLCSIQIEGRARGLLPFVVQMLSGISPTIETVGLALSGRHLSSFTSPEWSRIEHIVLGAPYKKLRSLNVTLVSPINNGIRLARWTAEQAEAEIRAKLPGCEERGILALDSR
jgi:hypothetical protein